MKYQKIKLQMVKEQSIEYTTQITKPIDIVDFINKYEDYSSSPNEKIIVIGLNRKNKVNIYTEIASGPSGFCNCTIADMFKPLLISNSSKFIIAHNHPTGDSKPSKEDIKVTKKIMDSAKLMGLEFLDHIVIGDNSYNSIMSIFKGGE